MYYWEYWILQVVVFSLSPNLLLTFWGHFTPPFFRYLPLFTVPRYHDLHPPCSEQTDNPLHWKKAARQVETNRATVELFPCPVMSPGREPWQQPLAPQTFLWSNVHCCIKKKKKSIHLCFLRCKSYKWYKTGLIFTQNRAPFVWEASWAALWRPAHSGAACTRRTEHCGTAPGLAVLRPAGIFFCPRLRRLFLSAFFPLQHGHLYGCCPHPVTQSHDNFPFPKWLPSGFLFKIYFFL